MPTVAISRISSSSRARSSRGSRRWTPTPRRTAWRRYVDGRPCRPPVHRSIDARGVGAAVSLSAAGACPRRRVAMMEPPRSQQDDGAQMAGPGNSSFAFLQHSDGQCTLQLRARSMPRPSPRLRRRIGPRADRRAVGVDGLCPAPCQRSSQAFGGSLEASSPRAPSGRRRGCDATPGCRARRRSEGLRTRHRHLLRRRGRSEAVGHGARRVTAGHERRAAHHGA